MVIASIYRPPSGNKIEFIEQLTTWIESLNNKSMYLAGDFNLNYLNEDIQYYNRIEHLTGLKANIREITRIVSQSCIDNILTDITGDHKVSELCIADHQGMISKLKVMKIKQQKQRFLYREMKEANWLKFSTEVAKLNVHGTSVNEKWNNLCDDVKKAVEKSFPEKSSNIKYTFHMSRGLLKSKHKKNKLLRQYKRGTINKEVYIESIAYRLATRAKNEIKEIEIARSKKGLTKKYINKCLLIDYAQPCRIRNCLNCQNIT